MDLVHDRGSMEQVQSGGPRTPGPCFVLWIQSNHKVEFSNLSFPIAHLPAGRLTCANSGEIFVADPPSSGFMNGGRQNFPPIHTSGMSLISQANHSSDRLYKVYKSHGGVLLRFWPCLCLSFNIKFDHDPFDVFICCSTVILKNALMLKVALKIVTLIFWDCFHLDFKDHVSRRKYYAARNLSCDRCVI